LVAKAEQLSGQANESELVERSSSSRNAYLIISAILLLVTAVFGFQSFYPKLIGPISNVLPSILAGAALACAGLCVRKYGLKLSENFARMWFLFALGPVCWLIAEVTWATYYFFLNVPVPYPSIADIFYLAAYAPLSIGVFLYFRSFSGALPRRRLIASACTIVAAAILVFTFVIPTELSIGNGPIETITDLAYPALDLVLFSLAVLSLAIFLGGSIGKWWVLLVGAIILDIVADEYFLYLEAKGTYYNGSIDDLIYLWAYLIFALAFYVHKKEL
jgi:hypothetical protein